MRYANYFNQSIRKDLLYNFTIGVSAVNSRELTTTESNFWIRRFSNPNFSIHEDSLVCAGSLGFSRSWLEIRTGSRSLLGLFTVVGSLRGLFTVVGSLHGLFTVVGSFRGLLTVVGSLRGLFTVVGSFCGLFTVVGSLRGLWTVGKRSPSLPTREGRRFCSE